VSAPPGRQPVAVEVTWTDGGHSQASVALDGSFLVARHGTPRSRSLTVLGADRSSLLEIEGP
jgi:hypothetical protein